MNGKNKGGRPRTDRTKPVTFRISDEAKSLLDDEHNKTELIDALIRGKVARIKCPKCGEVITIKEEL